MVLLFCSCNSLGLIAPLCGIFAGVLEWSGSEKAHQNHDRRGNDKQLVSQSDNRDQKFSWAAHKVRRHLHLECLKYMLDYHLYLVVAKEEASSAVHCTL